MGSVNLEGRPPGEPCAGDAAVRKEIVDIQLRWLEDLLRERKMAVELTDAAKEMIAREGFDPVYGARPPSP